MAQTALDGRLLDELFTLVESRRSADPVNSRTARLFDKGIPKIAQKVGEEAVEALIEGVAGNRARLVEESADLLYHLIVLWAACGTRPDEVWAALESRMATARSPGDRSADETKGRGS